MDVLSLIRRGLRLWGGNIYQKYHPLTLLSLKYMSSQLWVKMELWREKVTWQNRGGQSRDYLKGIRRASLVQNTLSWKAGISLKHHPIWTQSPGDGLGQQGIFGAALCPQKRQAFSKVLKSSSGKKISPHSSSCHWYYIPMLIDMSQRDFSAPGFMFGLNTKQTRKIPK